MFELQVEAEGVHLLVNAVQIPARHDRPIAVAAQQNVRDAGSPGSFRRHRLGRPPEEELLQDGHAEWLHTFRDV
jgi:hypothetical protein